MDESGAPDQTQTLKAHRVWKQSQVIQGQCWFHMDEGMLGQCPLSTFGEHTKLGETLDSPHGCIAVQKHGANENLMKFSEKFCN